MSKRQRNPQKQFSTSHFNEYVSTFTFYEDELTVISKLIVMRIAFAQQSKAPMVHVLVISSAVCNEKYHEMNIDLSEINRKTCTYDAWRFGLLQQLLRKIVLEL